MHPMAAHEKRRGGQTVESLVDKKWSKNITMRALFVLRTKPICKKNAS
jgi:hypothetical protein